MGIRVLAVYILVTGLSIYAWKDWFKSLCGLIVLTAVLEYPDMPRSLAGIPGMNLWNILFGVVLLAWMTQRRRRGLTWDMPRYVRILVVLYAAVIVVGVFRAVLDRGAYMEYPVSALIMEELITTLKWILPAILLFDSCRTRRQVIMALICILTMYFLISIQVAKWIPPESALGGGGDYIHAKRMKLGREIGYHTTDVSVMLAGACWAMLASLALVRRNLCRLPVLAVAALIAYGQALTGGRGGYVAWGATGLMLCVLKWRKYLLLAPVVVVLLPIVLPGVTARMLEGFGATDVTGQSTVDEEAATSGRTLIWPYVLDEIAQSPWIGHGRLAMRRTGLYDKIETEYPGTGAPHPHNMYLETLHDNGLLGSIPILLFWALAVVYSAKLFRSRNPLYAAVGGLSFSLVFASLFAGISGQHVYPQEHTMCLWAAFFLMLRVRVEEMRAQMVLCPAEAVREESAAALEQNAMLTSGGLPAGGGSPDASTSSSERGLAFLTNA